MALEYWNDDQRSPYTDMDHLGDNTTDDDIEFANEIRDRLIKNSTEFSIGVALEAGGFEIIDQFNAANHDEAYEYAEKNHADLDWWVLDCLGEPINC